MESNDPDRVYERRAPAYEYEAFLWLEAISQLPYSKRAKVLDLAYALTCNELGAIPSAAQYPLLLTATRLRTAWKIAGIPLPQAAGFA